MTTWAIVPIKAPEHCKTRLRGALSDSARIALVDAMLRHVLTVTASSAKVDRVYLLGPSRHDFSGITLLPDHGQGLNAELDRVLDTARQARIQRLIVLPADLPTLTRDDVDQLAAGGGIDAAIAPDRGGSGTNAIALPPGNTIGFRFRFGADSFGKHRTEIAAIQRPVRILNSPTLALDVDEIEDLTLLPPAFAALI